MPTRRSPSRVNAPDAWYSEPRFLDAHVARIEEAAALLPDPDPAATVLLYSAHSLPVSTIEKRKEFIERNRHRLARFEQSVKADPASRSAWQAMKGGYCTSQAT